MKKMMSLFLVLLSYNTFAQNLREVSGKDISVKLSEKKIIGPIKFGTLIDVYEGKRLLFTTSTSDSVEEAKREVEAFINLQTVMAERYNKKLMINVEAAQKSHSPLGEIKALFAFSEVEDYEDGSYKDCVEKLKETIGHENHSQFLKLDSKLSKHLTDAQVLSVDQKDIVIKYKPRTLLGMNNGTDVDIYVKNKLVHSIKYGLADAKEVHRELTPFVTQMRASKKPVVLQFGKSQRNGAWLTQTDRFKEIFDQGI